jgi:hypothetical protein
MYIHVGTAWWLKGHNPGLKGFRCVQLHNVWWQQIPIPRCSWEKGHLSGVNTTGFYLNALLCVFLERRQGGISLFSLVISVNIFWAEIYWGRHFLGQNELKLSPLSKLRYAIFFQVKTTTHFIRLTPVKLFIGCFFFFVQLHNYISNLSLLKYFIQKIYGKRDISQQVVTLSKFGNARICHMMNCALRYAIESIKPHCLAWIQIWPQKKSALSTIVIHNKTEICVDNIY